MKSALTILTGFFLVSFSIAQKPIEVTSEIQNKLKLSIEKDVPNLKQKLEKEKVNPVIIEFMLDTFRVEKFMQGYIKLDFSDFGMRDAGYQTASLYDSLLNKYYKKLLGILQGDDKKVLIQAQKAWLAFRDSETKLVITIAKDDYSGGGTVQVLTNASEYLDLIRNRTIAIFNHFTRATQNF
jgi:uncharacterized protein YecT (DUF1311 family)